MHHNYVCINEGNHLMSNKRNKKKTTAVVNNPSTAMQSLAHLACMTSMTREHFAGKRLCDLEPDMEKNLRSKDHLRQEYQMKQRAAYDKAAAAA